MKHALFAALFAISTLATYAYAAESDPNTTTGDDVQVTTTDESNDASYIPADQLDSTQYQTEELRPQPGPHPHPPHPPHPPRPPHPRPHLWECLARDVFHRGYIARDWDINWARRDAMMTCEQYSWGCRLVGCQPY